MQPIDTVEQRLSVYEQALEFINLRGVNDCQMCYMFMKVLPVSRVESLSYFLDAIAPKLVEWWEQKPEHYITHVFASGYKAPTALWFELDGEGRQKRIRVIENAIDQCKQKLKTQI